MAAYTDQLIENDPLQQGEEIQQMMIQKATELFTLCDKEKKGFITKRDMQRLQQELPLSPDQLEDVFDSLDDDGNGFLTLEEFTEGFGDIGFTPLLEARRRPRRSRSSIPETVQKKGSFIGLAPPSMEKEEKAVETSSGSGEKVYENDHVDSAEEEEHFNDMLQNLGAYGMFENQETLKAVWTRLRRDEPEMLGNFEEFIGRVSTEIKRTHQDYQSLESALRNKTSAHDEEMRKLYDEMENQIKAEKERVIAEEKARERQMRDEMEREILEKDKQLQELLSRHQEMEEQLEELNLVEAETKQENERLAKEKEQLEKMLSESDMQLDESKSYINQLRQQQRDDKRDRAMAALQISEGIALERESLVKQLDMLRDVNKKLRDDKDEADMRRAMLNGRSPYQRDSSTDSATGVPDKEASDASSSTSRRKQLAKQGSILSNYMSGGRQSRLGSSLGPSYESEGIEDDGIEYEVYEPPPLTATQANLVGAGTKSAVDSNSNEGKGGIYRQGSGQKRSIDSWQNRVREEATSSDNDNISNTRSKHDGRRKRRRPRHRDSYSDSEGAEVDGRLDRVSPMFINGIEADDECDVEDITDHIDAMVAHAVESFKYPPTPKGPFLYNLRTGSFSKQRSGDEDFSLHSRGQPVGANDSLDHTDYIPDSATVPSVPERVFKVVFVGDSGVGKSSFIHRFCNDEFKSTFSATIGVDFQVRTLVTDGHLVALQLWDTAGQERFRSITKQYFRKADGVLIMYDVTSESSFTNVRNWMISVQDGVEEGTVLAIVGNKTDLSEEDESRAVKTKDGEKLALEYEALFYETSAKTGSNVKECLEGMASLLQEKEDRDMEKALTLTEGTDPKKKKTVCCGTN